MSGWGCRYQLDEQCLRLRKACKPGIPGCVLYGKVRFISDVEAEGRQKKGKSAKPSKRNKRRGTAARSAPGKPRAGTRC